MLERIRILKEEIASIKAATPEEVDELRIKYISKKGKVNQLFAEFKNVPADQKKDVGQAINVLKNFAQEKIKYNSLPPLSCRRSSHFVT